MKAENGKIEVLVEDKSGSLIAEGLILKILKREGELRPDINWKYEIRPHRGIGSLPKNPEKPPLPYTSTLLGLLPYKMRAYTGLDRKIRPQLVLVIFDADEKNPKKLFDEVLNVCTENAPNQSSVIGLAVEELESWLLGDRKALLRAYPDADTEVLDSYEQDSICGTWELLARAIIGKNAERLIAAGYPAVGTYKYEWAEKISPYLDPFTNKSPSAGRFTRYFIKCLRIQEDRIRRNEAD